MLSGARSPGKLNSKGDRALSALSREVNARSALRLTNRLGRSPSRAGLDRPMTVAQSQRIAPQSHHRTMQPPRHFRIRHRALVGGERCGFSAANNWPFPASLDSSASRLNAWRRSVAAHSLL